MNLTDHYFGDQPAWRKVIARVEVIAPLTWPILLLGPRGSGKTLLARYIHARSGRSGEFMACPAPSLPESLLQSELLGNARFAFTDAREERKGLLELAHQGTLFLDEIEAASHATQSFLVGQVEQKELRRVGDLRARPVEVRFIYASNADLTGLVAQGRFRADLLDRIGGTPVRVPALAEYKELVVQLAGEFLRDCLTEMGREPFHEFSLDVVRLFLGYEWPGNLRELRDVCREIAIRLPESGAVLPEHLPESLLLGAKTGSSSAAESALFEQVARTLRDTLGNKSEAARLLAIPRSQLLRICDRMSRRAAGNRAHPG